MVSNGQAPSPELFAGQWANVRPPYFLLVVLEAYIRQVHQGLNGPYRDVLGTYWQATLRRLEDDDHDYKMHQLPLARIKKVMKADPEVKMISAEAPILFAKGCDIFITELTMRAWIHAEENKRRTLQRSDIASALTKSDMFDFLIDIVPREEASTTQSKRPPGAPAGQSSAAPPQAPPQQAVPQQPQHPPPQHHPGLEYGAFPPHMAPEHEYRPPQMYVPQGPPDPAYAQPPPMYDHPNIYGGYPMPPPQV